MGKRYVVKFGAQLLESDFDGIQTIVPFRKLPVYTEEYVFLTEEAARKFSNSERSAVIQAEITEWLVSREGLDWEFKQEQQGIWCSKCVIFLRRVQPENHF